MRRGDSSGALVLAGSVAGLLGGILCLLLTPIQSRAWNGRSAPFAVRSVNGFVAFMTDLRKQVAPGISNYYFFGRLFFLVYLLALVALWAFHVRVAKGDARERSWFRVLVVSLVVGAVADTGPYWGGLDSPFAATFLLEELALLGILVASFFYGRALLLGRLAPRWLGWGFVLSPPLAVLTTWLSGYFPHGPMLPFTVAAAAAGMVAWRSPGPGPRTASGTGDRSRG